MPVASLKQKTGFLRYILPAGTTPQSSTTGLLRTLVSHRWLLSLVRNSPSHSEKSLVGALIFVYSLKQNPKALRILTHIKDNFYNYS